MSHVGGTVLEQAEVLSLVSPRLGSVSVSMATSSAIVTTLYAGPTPVIILIDYDNLDTLVRRRGTRHVIIRLLDVLGSSRTAEVRRVDCRLYGGWLDEDTSSRNAERLIPDLRRDFPCSVPVIGAAGAQAVLVHVELARSLACDPAVVLTHTYRRRSLPPRLRCETAPFPGCAAPLRCPVAAIDPFIRNAGCPVDGCPVEPRAVLAREEQKLVDSMLVVDLIHFAETTDEPLVVVSADDDLWPGIRFVLLRGARVIHVIPRRGRVDRKRYRSLETESYSQVVM